ncbi:GntR family transcriptional regulator [Paeniglutamicibacter sp. MACA_103]|uniref:GntR family transcriptional regulator n=1 Tax=Paeniglutamicibacter sp. MACA_103 TaxID=3377337 RepID=UPI003893614A
MAIQRQSLREQIETEIMNRVGAGEFDMGESINEVTLSSELGVSRTPLREALISLAQQGVITRVSGKGFRWAPISERDYTEAVQIIAALECLALDLSPTSDLVAIAPKVLDMANSFTATEAPAQEVDSHDDVFHALLTSRCPNRRLIETIASHKVALRRYEKFFVSATDRIERAATEHSTIAQALIDQDLPAARAALSANWLNSTSRIAKALANKESAKAAS